MRIGNWTFTPGLWPSVATLLVVPFLFSLGIWQLDRAGQKRELHHAYMQRQQAVPLDLNQLNINLRRKQEILWHRVSAQGQFDESVQVLLDNQVRNNQAGYFIFTPFRLQGEDTWYLVNRGWLSAGPDRGKLPTLINRREMVRITGIAKSPQGTGITLGSQTTEEPVPGVFRVNRIELEKLQEQLGRELMPYVIRLDADSPAGYMRKWPQPGSDENMHLGYAFQWFALAILLLVIFFLVNLSKIIEQSDE